MQKKELGELYNNRALWGPGVEESLAKILEKFEWEKEQILRDDDQRRMLHEAYASRPDTGGAEDWLKILYCDEPEDRRGRRREALKKLTEESLWAGILAVKHGSLQAVQTRKRQAEAGERAWARAEARMVRMRLVPPQTCEKIGDGLRYLDEYKSSQQLEDLIED